MGTSTGTDTPRSGSSGDMTGPASSVDGNLVVFDGTDGKTLKDGGTPTVYLGPMTWAELQASAYANGSVGLAALAADATVFVTDWRVAMTPNTAKTFWTAPPFALDQHAAGLKGTTDVVYTANGAAPTAVASASAGAKTRLTYGGTAHGLTNTNDGVCVYVSAGSNWTVGFYPYTYVDATNIDLSVAWNASFGNPTVRSVTGALNQTLLRSVTIPAGLIQAKSVIYMSETWEMTSSANNRYLTILCSANEILQVTSSTQSSYFDRREIRFQNSKALQILQSQADTAYKGMSPNKRAIDFSTAKTLDYHADLRTVNEFIRITGSDIILSIGQ